MKYGDPVLDAIVNNHFKPAVADTGFILRRLDDEQPAGHRLRVEIQSSRFLLVDLTHSNLPVPTGKPDTLRDSGNQLSIRVRNRRSRKRATSIRTTIFMFCGMRPTSKRL